MPIMFHAKPLSIQRITSLAQTSFELDERTTKALEKLKKVYGVTSNAAALRRALAIAVIASDEADEEGRIHLIREKPDGTYKETVVPQII